jgi:hypothetical protein
MKQGKGKENFQLVRPLAGHSLNKNVFGCNLTSPRAYLRILQPKNLNKYLISGIYSLYFIRVLKKAL